MFTLALADSVLFLYVAVPLYLIFLTFMVEATNRTGFATFTLGAVLIALQLCTDIHPFTWILNNPLTTLVYVVGYIVFGVLYVYFKWKSFFGMAVRQINAYLARNKMAKPMDAARSCGYNSIPLRVSDYKYKITSWMAYWPISMAWTLLNDPLRRLFEYIYFKIAHTLQAMSNRAFADIMNKYNIPADED